MNPTFKQLEAFHYSARLGSFSAAAQRLHTTQSAMSKRVLELEAMLGVRLLHRRTAGLMLTGNGRMLLPLADEALRLRANIAAMSGRRALTGVLRIGVTELIALTWLTRLVHDVRQDHPGLRLEPYVESGVTLFRRLEAGQLDLAIMPGTYWKAGYTTVRVGQTRDAWMVSADTPVPDRPLRPAEFARFPVLEPSEESSKRRFYETWRADHQFVFGPVLYTNSLGVRREMLLAGMGVSQMPLEYFRRDVREGRLKVVRSAPPLPPMVYSAVYLQDGHSGAVGQVVERACALCDFSCRPDGEAG